jgi:hypothetical protein
MPRFVLSSNANRSASDIARRAQAKTLYSAALTKQTGINAQCRTLVPNVNSIANLNASTVTAVAQGAQESTIDEQTAILANATCSS